MMFLGKKTAFLRFFTSLHTIGFFAVFSCVFVYASSAHAAWNLPTCNPDAVGPTDPSCLVSAPLNVSASDQTKTGGLTIQNTVNAGQLNVSSAYSGNGRVAITTPTGTALTITHTDGLNPAAILNANTSSNALQVVQSGAGVGINVQSGAQSGLSSRNNSATNASLYGQNIGSGSAVYGTNNSGSNATIYGTNSGQYAAVYGTNSSATNSSIYGVNTNVAGAGGVRGCSSTSGYCGVLGTPSYAAFLSGPGTVMSSAARITSGAGFAIYATNSGTLGLNIDTASDATGANITSAGTNATGLSITTTGTNSQAVNITSSTTSQAANISISGANGTGLNISSSGATSRGVAISLSTSGTGVLVSGNATTGVQSAGTTAGVVGTSIAGVGVQGTSTTGYGGWFGSATTTNSAVYAQNTSTGDGLTAETGGVTAGSIPDPSGWPLTGGRGVRGTSSTSYGVVGYSTAATGYGVGVYGRATNNYGVVGYSNASYGVYGNSEAAALYGGLFCNTSNVNCASVGGGTFSGFFNGRLRVDATTSANAAARIVNQNTVAPYGYALTAYSQVGLITPVTPADGTAIDGQAYNGSGIFGYSQQDTGVTGSGNDGGVYGTSTSAGGYGIYGQTTGGHAVQGAATTGFGGYFTASGSGSTALSAINTFNGGAGVVVNTKGVGIDITTNTTTATATGITINAIGGQKGIVIAASSTGIDVNTSSGYGIELNDDAIHTTGAYLGGQFYPNEATGNGLMPNVQLATSSGESIGTVGFKEYGVDMIYDGSQLFTLTTSSLFTSKIVRHDVVTGQKIHESDTGALNARALTLVDETAYAFISSSANVYTENIHSGTSATTTKGNAFTVNAATTDGKNIWYGTSNAVYEWNPVLTSSNARKSGIGSVADVIMANGYVWASDTTNDVVYKISPVSPYTSTTITVGDAPNGLAYDGAAVWVANGGDSTITRIDVDTNSTVSVNASTLGTTPTDLAFDGTKLWISFTGSDEIGYYDTANMVLSTNAISITDPGALVFDGARVWSAEAMTNANDSGDIFKVYTGNGNSHGNPSIKKGILLYNNAGALYCLYLNGATPTASTTLTECQ